MQGIFSHALGWYMIYIVTLDFHWLGFDWCPRLLKKYITESTPGFGWYILRGQ